MLVWNCSLANSTSALVHGSTLSQQVPIYFYSLFGVIFDEIWEIIKIIAPYQISGYKTLELVVESELISSSDYYDPTSIPESINPVMIEKWTHSRAWEQPPSRISIQNMNVDKNEDEEEWHVDVENDDIQDTTYINMDEIENAINVEEIVKEW
jgi:hypothetical protein